MRDRNRIRRKTIVSLLLIVSVAIACLLNVEVKAQAFFPLNTTIKKAVKSLGHCQPFYADTNRDHRFELYDHHQSFELSTPLGHGHRLAFISHSETGRRDKGQLLAFDVDSHVFDYRLDLFDSASTMALKKKHFMSEKHPSGMAWISAPAPLNYKYNHGYLFVASENEKQLDVYQVIDYKGSDSAYKGVHFQLLPHSLNISPWLDTGTDVWITENNGYIWLIIHNMNAAKLMAFRADKQPLFDSMNRIKLSEFAFVNESSTPSNTGCGKSLGQNAQIVQDNTSNWYLVHSYASACGIGIGSNMVQAYPVSFVLDDKPHFSVKSQQVVKTSILTSSFNQPSADGASGFRVNQHGVLISYLGSQYASAGFNPKSKIVECKAL